MGARPSRPGRIPGEGGRSGRDGGTMQCLNCGNGSIQKEEGRERFPPPRLFLFSAADDEDIAFGVADDGLGDAADDKAFDGI